MTDAFGTAALVIMAALLGGVIGSLALGTPVGRLGPMARNFRGFQIPVNLGIVLVVTVIVTRLVVLLVIAVSGGTLGLSLVAQLGAVALAFAGGFYDDLQPERVRGVARQVAALVKGRVTPGVVKLIAAVAAGAVAVAAVGGDGMDYLLGIPVIAGFANLGNLLDVRPGRAIKFFVPVAVAVGALGWPGQSMLLTAVTFGGAAAVLPADLGERGMLGDGGAYVLWIVLGIGLFDAVGRTGLVVALAVVVALHLLSETVTLSRLIRWLVPLRMVDEVGRMEPLEPDQPPAAGARPTELGAIEGESGQTL